MKTMKRSNNVEMFPSLDHDDKVQTFECRGYRCAMRLRPDGYWEVNIPVLDTGDERWYGKHPTTSIAKQWVRAALKDDGLLAKDPFTRPGVSPFKSVEDPYGFINETVLTPLLRLGRTQS